tara:strand:+ start:185 stop:1084 length:900 start_codon:yes stop_codon:yes gene_type:complete
MSKHIFWIASYPKSGNTLVRSILTSLFFSDTGIFSFDLLKKIVSFEELSRLTKCYNTRAENINKKNWKDKSIIIFQNLRDIQKKINLGFNEDFAFFKTHFSGKNFDSQSFFIEEYLRGIIYVYRDPRDVCLSWGRFANLSKNESINFMLNESAWISWIGKEKFKDYSNDIPVFLSSWENHISSWINLKHNCPFLLLNYEDLVYKKKDTIKKIIDFFENNIKIRISNKDIKINNIIGSTSFNNLRKLEIKQGFNESINENQFFAVGKKNQWKSELKQNQIKIIEDKFRLIMKKLKYKLNN